MIPINLSSLVANAMTPRYDPAYPLGNRDGVWRGNEPVGMTIGTFSTRNMASSTDGGPWFSAGVPYTIVDTTSGYDDGNGKAIRCIYPAGLTSGQDSPSVTGYAWAGSRQVYLCFAWKCSSNWQGHNTGTNKIVYISSVGQGGGSANPAFISYETGLVPPQISLRNQGMVVGLDMSPNLATVPVAPGQEVLIEALLTLNSGAGIADGDAALWINGIKTSQYTGLNWTTSKFVWDQITFDSIWGGGGGDVVLADMYQELARLHLSIK